MSAELQIAGLRRRAASYRRHAANLRSAQAQAIYIDWATEIERRADAMAHQEEATAV